MSTCICILYIVLLVVMVVVVAAAATTRGTTNKIAQCRSMSKGGLAVCMLSGNAQFTSKA